MSRQYTFAFVFLCGFAALTASTEPCKENVLQGTSCTIKIKTNSNIKPTEVSWAHTLTNGKVNAWKMKKNKSNNPPDIKMEEDGSITFVNISQKDSGTYKYTAYCHEGKQIGIEEVRIKVYAKAPKPTVNPTCNADASAVVTCQFEDRKDMLVSWIKDGSIMQNENKLQLVLKSAEVKEEKEYSCNISNPVSKNQSVPTKVSCSGSGSGSRKLFGFDFWIMVGILTGGGVLLLLLICVLITCSCRSCRQRKKQQDEEEFRLQAFQDPVSNGTNRSKNTARGQPAPPIPQEETTNGRLAPNTPPPQPKAQVRGRPPPPPQDDDEEYPPPLPRPRNKQQRKRNQEPYRPME